MGNVEKLPTGPSGPLGPPAAAEGPARGPVHAAMQGVDSRLPQDKPTLEEVGKSLQKVMKYLSQEYAVGGNVDPTSGPHAIDPSGPFRLAAQFFRSANLTAAAEALLLRGYTRFGECQRQSGRRAKRALLTCDLGMIKAKNGDNGASLRWLLLTHADDVLGKHRTGGLGKALLLSLHGLPTAGVDRLTEVADTCREEVEHKSRTWSIPAGFAEEVLRRFTGDEEYGLATVRQAISVSEYPLCPAYLSSLLDSEPTESTQEKGDRLERIAAYLCSLLPGCVPRSKLLDQDRAFESDIVVRNLLDRSHLASELLGRDFIVECKNLAKRVGAEHVGYFLYRMRLTHARFGIIFARKGITGEEDGRAASELIRRAFHEDGSLCIVLSRKDLDQMADGSVGSFWWMVLRKIELFRFGKQKN